MKIEMSIDEILDMIENYRTNRKYGSNRIEPDMSITCSKCGMKWKGAMLYSCPDYKCPVQVKATF